MAPKLLLVYPPVANATQPYLSLPALMAWLRQEGFDDVEQLDLNIATTHRLLAPDRLRRAWRWCWHRLEGVRRGEVTVSPRHLEYIQTALGFGDDVVDAIDAAKKVFTTEAFYEPEQYLDAQRTLLCGYLLLSARYFPTVLGNGTLTMGYRCDRSADLIAAARDEEANPLREIMEELLEERFERDGVPDVVGISVGYYEQLIPSLSLAALIKARWPSVHVTLGGTMISAFHGMDLNPDLFDLFDSLVYFEGERALVALLQALESGADLATVPNLARRIDGVVQTAPILEPALRVDELPPPDFGDIAAAGYLSPTPVLPVAASRGCYWRRCTFCSRQHLQQAFLARTAESVVDELALLSERHGARHFFFVDECISPPMLRRMAHHIEQRGLDIEWSCYARFEKGLDDPELCQTLYRAGLRMIYFGLESANDRVLELMQKGTPTERISRILHATGEAGIMNMILYFVGFPTETREEALQTMDFLLAHEQHVHFAIAGKFVLEQQSPIYWKPEDFDVTHIAPLTDDSDLNVLYRHETGSGMSDAEIDEIQALVNERTRHLQCAEVLNRSHLLILGADYVTRSRRAALATAAK